LDALLLRNPVFADRWRRITFFYTTGYLLNQATSIRDLVVEGEDRNILWKTLKERSKLNYENSQTNDNYNALDIDFLEILMEWDKIKENS